MTLIFLCSIIIVITFYSLYSGINKLDADEKKEIEEIDTAKIIEIKAKIKTIGININHHFPDFIPAAILDEKSDIKANVMAKKWGAEQYLRQQRMFHEVNGLYIEMSYLDNDEFKTTNLISEQKQDIDPYAFAVDFVKQKTHVVYKNTNTGDVYITKPSKQDIEQNYRDKTNKEMLRGGIVCAASIIITLVFI